MKLKEIKAFERNGRQPFSDWFKKVKDQKTKERILTRFERIIHGNYGYHWRIKADFFELKERIGGGIRIYLGEDKGDLIILLLGGDKSSQEKDIKKALNYWQEYKNNGGKNGRHK